MNDTHYRQPGGVGRETILSPSQWRRRRARLAAIVVGLTSLFAAVGYGIYWLSEIRHTRVTVDHRGWTRALHLEELTEHGGEGWHDRLPDGAYDTHCETRHRGSERCHPHDCHPHTKLSRGRRSTVYDTCYDSCEVRDDWCSYHVKTWDEREAVLACGAGDRAPVDPVLGLAPSLAPADLGPTRRVIRVERYTVFFREVRGEHRWQQDFDLPRYRLLTEGRVVRAVWREYGAFEIDPTSLLATGAVAP